MNVQKSILAALISLSFSPVIAGESLFIPSSNLKMTQGKIIAATSSQSTAITSPLDMPFLGDNTVLNARAGMRVNPNAFTQNEMSITLPDGTVITPKKINRYTTYTGSTVWIGITGNHKPNNADYAMNQTILVFRDGRITGTIDHDRKRYYIRAARNGDHTIARVNPSFSFSDHDDRSYKMLPRIAPVTTQNMQKSPVNARPEIAEFDQEMHAARTAAKSINPAIAAAPVVYNPVLRVMVNYTMAVKNDSDTPDILAAIDDMIAKANTAYANSGSTTRLTLAYAAPVSYVEKTGLGIAGNTDFDKDAYGKAYNYDGVDPNLMMKEVKFQREMYSPDVSILLTKNQIIDKKKICGSAASIGVGDNANTAYAVVDIGCAKTQFSFTHEIAHLFGSRHGVEEDDAITPHEHGHGYKSGTTVEDRGTIMSRQKNVGSTQTDFHSRINYFSAPNLSFKKTPNGPDIPLGNAEKADNARVTREVAPAMARLTPPPTGFPLKRDAYIIVFNSTDFTVAKFKTTTTGVEPEYIPRVGTKSFIFEDMTVNLNISRQSKSIPVTNLNSLIELYIAFFNRVPDAEGLDYWIGEFKRGLTLNQISDSFYAAALRYPEETGYHDKMSNNDFIRIVYKNVLRRDLPATDEGIMYWAEELRSGRRSRGEVVGQILNSARTFKDNPTYGWIVKLLDNKITVGKVFSIQKGLSYRIPALSVSKGMAIAAAVTDLDTTAAINLIGVRDVNFFVPQ